MTYCGLTDPLALSKAMDANSGCFDYDGQCRYCREYEQGRRQAHYPVPAIPLHCEIYKHGVSWQVLRPFVDATLWKRSMGITKLFIG